MLARLHPLCVATGLKLNLDIVSYVRGRDGSWGDEGVYFMPLQSFMWLRTEGNITKLSSWKIKQVNWFIIAKTTTTTRRESKGNICETFLRSLFVKQEILILRRVNEGRNERGTLLHFAERLTFKTEYWIRPKNKANACHSIVHTFTKLIFPPLSPFHKIKFSLRDYRI